MHEAGDEWAGGWRITAPCAWTGLFPGAPSGRLFVETRGGKAMRLLLFPVVFSSDVFVRVDEHWQPSWEFSALGFYTTLVGGFVSSLC